MTAVAASLIGSSQDARAAVFEQTDSGKVVVIRDGAPAGAPSRPNGQAGSTPGLVEYSFPAPSASGHEDEAAPIASALVETLDTTSAEREDVPTDGSVAPPLLPSTATPSVGMLHDAAAISRQIGARLTALRLPRPRTLPDNLSNSQRTMRALAVDVARRHSHTPGVRTAGLDQRTFIKLFTTLIHRESNFNERAVSPVGAKGLGQLMPSTARELGVRNALSAKDNLEGSAIYLTAMLERFGSPELALAAYNAGPSAVEKYEGIPPYRETRQYVADIFAEVGREPHPAFAEAPAPAAPSMETAGVVTNPFTLVDPASAVRNRPQGPDKDAPVVLAFAPTPAVRSAPAKPTATASQEFIAPAPTHQKAEGEQQQPEPALTAAQGRTANGQKEAAPTQQNAPSGPQQPMPSPTVQPKLDPLPSPREFVGTLTKNQEVMRDLAVDTALRHTQDPGVVKAQVRPDAFATLFVAMIRRESSFNPQAISSKGAQGLGQLSPATARALGVKDVFSPAQNLDASARLLADMLGQFRSPALALAAYSAGPRAVLRAGGRLPDDPVLRQHVADVLHDAASDVVHATVAARSGPATGKRDEITAQTSLPAQHAPSVHPAQLTYPSRPVKPPQEARMGPAKNGSAKNQSPGSGLAGVFAIAVLCGTFSLVGLSGLFARRFTGRNASPADSCPSEPATSAGACSKHSTARVMPFPSRPHPAAKAEEAAVSAGASA